MKKLISFVLTIVILVSTVALTATATEIEYDMYLGLPYEKITPMKGKMYGFMGDVDFDNEVSVIDATAIQHYVAQLSQLSGDALLLADVDEDSEVSVIDATEIQLWIAKLTDNEVISRTLYSDEIEIPRITSVENTENGTTVTWNKVQGAIKYKLFYKRDDGNGWKTIVATTDDYYTYSPLENGKVITYTVRACDSNGEYISSYDKTGVTNVFVAPLTLKAIGVEETETVMSWTENELAYGYRVYRKSYNGSYEALFDVTENYCEIADFPVDTLYTYSVRAIDENGKELSYYSTFDRYFYNGEPANGEFVVNDGTLNFIDGYHARGYTTIGGKLYYFDENGSIMKNGIVGSKEEGYYYADENGVCCTSEEMRLAAEFMMNNCTGSTLTERMKTGFMYMATNFPYNRTYDHPTKASDIPPLAIDMFTNKKGNCFRYAACFACTARIAGYRTRVVVGDLLASGGYWTPHGWVEVYVDGKWKVCDPNMQMQLYYLPYSQYMTDTHNYTVRATVKYEVTIVDGVAVWE